MPSTSAKQHRFMEMVAHDPAAAKRVGVPQSVGRDFANADRGRTMAKYKGSGPVSTSYAAGGPVLGRTREFMKEPDEFRDPDEGNAKADKDQLYGKTGEGKGNGVVPAPAVKQNKRIK